MDPDEHGFNTETPRTRRFAEGKTLWFSASFAVLSRDFAHFSKGFCRGARVAQICNLLYCRIAFGGAPGVAKSSASAMASGLQIRETAEYNSALLWLRLRRAMPLRFVFYPCPSVSIRG
jgi:hypothetical protein